MRSVSLTRLSAIAAIYALGAMPAGAITITATTNANTLATSLLAGSTGIVLTSATFSGQQQTSVLASPAPETSSGTYTNTSGTYGIGPGIVLTSGAVEERSYVDTDLNQTIVLPGYGDGPNAFPDPGYYSGTAYLVDSVQTPASAEQEALLDPVYGPFDHYDATELLITFDMLPGYSAVTFNVAYGTEEYTNFINSAFVDIFAAFLNGANVALVGNKPVNVDHPDFAAVSGTELNGLLAPGGNPLLTFSGAVNPAGNTLRLIITDTGDSVLDSTVYVSGLTAVPLPASVWLLVTGLAGLASRCRWRRPALQETDGADAGVSGTGSRTQPFC